MPTVGSRAAGKQATRERLIRAAYRCFCRDGIGGTRVTDVAAAAGVAHGTAFLHYPTRDDLVAAVIRRYTGQIAARIHELAGAGAGLREVLQAHLAGLRAHERFYARLVTEGPLLGEAARTTLIGMHSAISLHLSTAARRETAGGRLRRVPVDFLFNLWIGLVHHYLANRELFARRGSVLERCGPKLIAQFVRLLSVHPDEDDQ